MINENTLVARAETDALPPGSIKLTPNDIMWYNPTKFKEWQIEFRQSKNDYGYFHIYYKGKPTQFNMRINYVCSTPTNPITNKNLEWSSMTSFFAITLYGNDALELTLSNTNYRYVHLFDNFYVWCEAEVGVTGSVHIPGWDGNFYARCFYQKRNTNTIHYTSYQTMPTLGEVYNEINGNYITNWMQRGISTRGSNAPTTYLVSNGSSRNSVYCTFFKYSTIYYAVLNVKYTGYSDRKSWYSIQNTSYERVNDQNSIVPNIIANYTAVPQYYLSNNEGTMLIGSRNVNVSFIPESINFCHDLNFDTRKVLHMANGVEILLFDSKHELHVISNNTDSLLNVSINDKGDLVIQDYIYTYYISHFMSMDFTIKVLGRTTNSYNIKKLNTTSWEISLF